MCKFCNSPVFDNEIIYYKEEFIPCCMEGRCKEKGEKLERAMLEEAARREEEQYLEWVNREYGYEDYEYPDPDSL